MEVILKNLELTNFKGIKSLSIDFNSSVTDIYGDNGTGKTTVFDAFLWLLFGKDSKDRKDFGIKTLDSAGNEIHKIEHNVTAKISIDGVVRTFSRTLREKWVKKRGSFDENFEGNETLYEIDNVPLKQSEYSEKIKAIIDEDAFKLITNPTQFCAAKWQTQRNILMGMAELNSDLDIAAENSLQSIIDCINSGKTVTERAKELANSKKKIIKEMEAVPVRIDEIMRTFPNNEMRTATVVDVEIADVKDKIKALENEISLMHNNDVAKTKIETKIKQIEAEMVQAEAEAKSLNAEIKAENDRIKRERNSKIEALSDDIRLHKKTIADCKRELNEVNALLEKLRSDFKAVRDKQFDDFKCPVCGREYEEHKLKELQDNFNSMQASKKAEINKRGNELKQGAEYNEGLIAKKTNELEALTKELEILESTPTAVKTFYAFDNTDYIKRIESAKKELENCAIDTSKQDIELSGLNARLSVLEQEMADINGAAKGQERIAELEQSLKDKTQAVADIEKEEEELHKFTEIKIAMLSEAINNKFNIVKFKLYDVQINGGYVECCEATVNGVPYRDLNSAMKINAGLDIINTLQGYYGISAPVFIDNKESINEIAKVNSQLICLTVTNDKELVINNKKEVA